MEQRKQLIDVVDSFDTAILLTGMDGDVNGRPMSIAGNEDGDLWFITAKNSPKAGEVRADADALVTLQSPTAYAVVHGKAAIVDDAERLKALWNRGADLYFPDGADTEEATLLRFSPTKGEYWDMRGTRGLDFAAKAAKALWNGESIDSNAAAHGEASL
jgi:general stress protein 26